VARWDDLDEVIDSVISLEGKAGLLFAAPAICYGRSAALMLSGGAVLGVFHGGWSRALLIHG